MIPFAFGTILGLTIGIITGLWVAYMFPHRKN
jgi:hypothetical protein